MQGCNKTSRNRHKKTKRQEITLGGYDNSYEISYEWFRSNVCVYVQVELPYAGIRLIQVPKEWFVLHH